MKNINYSIIIPHKNIPNLLRRCLDSIPKRDDIQIIVVDDNSDNSKVDFNQFPGLGEEFVEVYFTKEGKGAGYARNVGLQHAKGKWLLFADADDFFTENINKILDEYINNENDIIYFLITSVYTDTLEPCKRGDFVNDIILDAICNNKIESLRYKRLEPWAKIIKRELVIRHNIKFDETIAANDLKFSVLSGRYAYKVNASSQVLYCLTMREGSLAFTISKEVCDAKLDVILQINNLFYKWKLMNFRINILPYIWHYKNIDCFLFIEKFIYSLSKSHVKYFVLDLFFSFKNIIKKMLN